MSQFASLYATELNTLGPAAFASVCLQYECELHGMKFALPQKRDLGRSLPFGGLQVLEGHNIEAEGCAPCKTVLIRPDDPGGQGRSSAAPARLLCCGSARPHETISGTASAAGHDRSHIQHCKGQAERCPSEGRNNPAAASSP